MAGEPTLTLVGNITANPEQRGDTVTFTIAHNTRRRDRNGQTVDGDAVFMRCAAFGDLAQNIMRSCYKGMRVVATGYMKTNNWTDKTVQRQRLPAEQLRRRIPAAEQRLSARRIQQLPAAGLQPTGSRTDTGATCSTLTARNGSVGYDHASQHGSERRRHRPGILNGSDIDQPGRSGRQPPPIQGGLSPTHRLLTGQQRGFRRHRPAV